VRKLLPSVLALALAAPALAIDEPLTRTGDLDGDMGLEVVRAEPVDVPGASFKRTKVTISDTCPAGPIRRRAAGIQDDLETLRLRRADTREGREVFTVLRSGARGVLGESNLVAWRRSMGNPCRKRRWLFRYDSDDPTRTPPGGNGDIESFRVRLSDFSDNYSGLELKLDERFQTDDDPPTFGSLKKVSYWRYKRSRDRYVRFRTKIRELQPPG
jgi:hypothetical protein